MAVPAKAEDSQSVLLSLELLHSPVPTAQRNVSSEDKAALTGMERQMQRRLRYYDLLEVHYYGTLAALGTRNFLAISSWQDLRFRYHFHLGTGP